MHLAQERD